MNTLFQKDPFKLPKQPIPKKGKYLFHSIGGGWYVNKLGQKLPPPIACNNDWRFYFGLGCLGSSSGVF